MAFSPWLLALLNGAVFIAAAIVAGYVLIGHGDAAADDENWGERAGALAREVRRGAEPYEPPADPDRVARRLLPLACRIQGHVRAAPSSADAYVYRRLFELGVACQRVAVEQRREDRLIEGPFLEDRLESLAARASELESTVESA